MDSFFNGFNLVISAWQETFRISAKKEFDYALNEPIPSDLDFEDLVKYTDVIVYQLILDANIVGRVIVSMDELTQL